MVFLENLPDRMSWQSCSLGNALQSQSGLLLDERPGFVDLLWCALGTRPPRFGFVTSVIAVSPEDFVPVPDLSLGQRFLSPDVYDRPDRAKHFSDALFTLA